MPPTTLAAIGFAIANLARPTTPLNILGINPRSFGINPAIVLTSNPTKPPNFNLNTINAANSAGQVALKNSPIALSFSLFFGSLNHPIILNNNLPINTFFINSNNPSNNPWTGLTNFFAVLTNFSRGPFSSLSSLPDLFTFSDCFLSLSSLFLPSLFCSLRVSRMDMTPPKMSFNTSGSLFTILPSSASGILKFSGPIDSPLPIGEPS